MLPSTAIKQKKYIQKLLEVYSKTPSHSHFQKTLTQKTVSQNQKYPELIFVSYEETDIKRSKTFKKNQKTKTPEKYRKNLQILELKKPQVWKTPLKY